MKTFSFVILLLFSLQTIQAQDINLLSDKIDSLFASTDGSFALAFKDLDSGQEILINEKQQFHAASTMKTPVMVEIFKQERQGKFSLEDSLLIKNEFRSIVSGDSFKLDIGSDSEDNLYKKIGQKVELRDLVTDMIIHSSNLATNLLIELVDAKKVTQTMRDLGAEDIMVLRGVEDIEAFDAGLNNTTTAYDLLLIFEALAEGKAVGEAADLEMIDILLQQAHNDIIPAKLPSEVKVAHKTGSITGVRHDSGIVFLPNGKKYILVLLSKEMSDPDKGVEMMAGISELIYEQESGN